MAYIFLDESGQFNPRNGERFFVVASFLVGNSRRTEKEFAVWQKSRFPKKLRSQSEIKFSEIKIDDKLRIKTLKLISSLDVRVRYSYLLKNNIPRDYIKKGQLQSGLLYTNIIGDLLELYLPCTDKEFRVFCDQRHLKGLKRSEFKKILISRLLPQLSRDTIIQIEMIDSAGNKNIQIADWISGAIARYLENKKLGKDCYLAIANNILGEGRELFKNEKIDDF
jgi:hypothetical protein